MNDLRFKVSVDVAPEEPRLELLVLCAVHVPLDLWQEMEEQADLIMSASVLGRVAPEVLSTEDL